MPVVSTTVTDLSADVTVVLAAATASLTFVLPVPPMFAPVVFIAPVVGSTVVPPPIAFATDVKSVSIVILFPDWVIPIFLPASIVTTSFGLMSSTVVPLTVPVDFDVVNCHLLFAILSSNWPTFTASVLFVPAPTPVIGFPPLFNPVGPNVTGLPAPLLIVIPPLFNVVSPAFILPVAPKSTLSDNEYVILPFDACSTFKFLPAAMSITSPGFITSSPVDDPNVPPFALDFNVNPELLIAFATSPAVTTFPASAVLGAVTDPFVPVVNVVVSNPNVYVVVFVPSESAVLDDVNVKPVPVVATSDLSAFTL